MKNTVTVFRISLIIAISVSFIAIAYWCYMKQQKERFVNATITILTSQQTADFLKRDDDNYIQSMSNYDLVARGMSSRAEYMQRASQAAYQPTSSDINKIVEAAKMVDSYLSKKKTSSIPSNLLHVPWVIAITSGKMYEEGYPHTRHNIIFLTSDMIKGNDLNDLAKTLLHEKVHVYQRMFPQNMDTWIADRGFQRWKLRASEPLSRANSDLDPWIYIDSRSQKQMVAVYNSDKPTSISDVKLTNFAFEHPYELMAYEIADASGLAI